MKKLPRLCLLIVGIFLTCLAFGRVDVLPSLSPINGQITAANVGTTVQTITANSGVRTAGISAGGTMSWTIPTNTASSATYHAYFSPDYSTVTGNGTLWPIPDSWVLNTTTGATGAPSGTATGVYSCFFPGGMGFVLASAYTGSGPISITKLAVTTGIYTSPISFTNGSTLFGNTSGEASTSVTTTPSALNLSSAPFLLSPIYVLVTNDGGSDAYVSTVSGGHTYRIPAGAGPVYIPTGNKPLFTFCPSGSTTLYCMQAGN